MCKYLKAGGSLSGHYLIIVKGRRHRAAAFAAYFVGDFKTFGSFAEDDLRPQLSDRVDFILRRRARHDDGALHAEQPRRVGERLAVVAG